MLKTWFIITYLEVLKVSFTEVGGLLDPVSNDDFFILSF